MPSDDPLINQLRASLAANTRWAREKDRSAATLAARRGLEARFAREVDPDGVLEPELLAQRIAAAKKAHMSKMALASAVARKKRAAGGK